MRISPKKWSTKAVEEFLKQISITGSVPRYSPFHKGDTSLRGADLDFSYTEDEIAEKTKIVSNIFYFAETYCNVMQDEGITKIKHLRKYQKKALVSFIKHLRTVWLASRQIGKCVAPQSKLITKNEAGPIENRPIFEIYYETKKSVVGLHLMDKFKLLLYRWKYNLYLKINNSVSS